MDARQGRQEQLGQRLGLRAVLRVGAAGAPQYRIGTTSGTFYSVADGTNAGLAGWGWNDNAYNGLAAPLYFATSGPQTIRVQVREDGLALVRSC